MLVSKFNITIIAKSLRYVDLKNKCLPLSKLAGTHAVVLNTLLNLLLLLSMYILPYKINYVEFRRLPQYM